MTLQSQGIVCQKFPAYINAEKRFSISIQQSRNIEHAIKGKFTITKVLFTWAPNAISIEFASFSLPMRSPSVHGLTKTCTSSCGKNPPMWHSGPSVQSNWGTLTIARVWCRFPKFWWIPEPSSGWCLWTGDLQVSANQCSGVLYQRKRRRPKGGCCRLLDSCTLVSVQKKKKYTNMYGEINW